MHMGEVVVTRWLVAYMLAITTRHAAVGNQTKHGAYVYMAPVVAWL